jgi:hypothetical protein
MSFSPKSMIVPERDALAKMEIVQTCECGVETAVKPA